MKANWQVGGPVLFAFLLFAIEFVVKGVAFDNGTIWFDLGPSLALWSVGVLFSLAVSEQTQLRGRIEYKTRPLVGGTGLELLYNVVVPQRLDFTPRYLYLFVVVLTLWILALVLSQDIANAQVDVTAASNPVIAAAAGSLFLGGVSVSLAVASLAEVGGQA